MIANLLNNHVALLFIIIGLGYVIGKRKIFGFELGPVSGVLLVGLMFGHFEYEFSEDVQALGFSIFIFSVGYQAGPRFISVLKTDGLKYFVLALVISLSGFAIALIGSNLFELTEGTSAGVLAGGLTSSPTLAAAQDAVRSGNIPISPGTTSKQVLTNITTGYAVTYIFGLIGLILLMKLLPKLMRVNLSEEAVKLELKTKKSGVVRMAEKIVTRAYRMTEDKRVGMNIKAVHEMLPGKVTVSKIRRNGDFLELTPETMVEMGDEIVLTGHLEHFKDARLNIGPELTSEELLSSPLEECQIIVSRSKIKNERQSPAEITAKYGCFVTKIKRVGVFLSTRGDVRIEPGDVLYAKGTSGNLDKLGNDTGYIEKALDETDLVTFGLGIALGILIGSLSFIISGVALGIGTAGGLLAAGILIGYLRSLHPTFGRMPDAVLWLFMQLGLLMFIAGVGLRAGTNIVETLVTSGPVLFLVGAAVTTIPVFIGFIFGWWILKINPVLLLGAITGSMTSGAALSIVLGEAKSPLPSLGYTGAYAFSNVLLTIAGSLILIL